MKKSKHYTLFHLYSGESAGVTTGNEEKDECVCFLSLLCLLLAELMFCPFFSSV